MKRDATRYLSFKRQYSKKRIFGMGMINFLFSLIGIFVLIFLDYWVLAIMLTVVCVFLSVFTVVKILKWKRIADSYYAASVAMLHTHIVFGLLWYSLVYNLLYIYLYIMIFMVSTVTVMLISFRFVKIDMKDIKCLERSTLKPFGHRLVELSSLTQVLAVFDLMIIRILGFLYA